MKLKQPPFRQLRSGAHLHATKGYRLTGASVSTKHAGAVQDPGTGGTVRRGMRRSLSLAQNLLMVGAEYRKHANGASMPPSFIKENFFGKQYSREEAAAMDAAANQMVAGA